MTYKRLKGTWPLLNSVLLAVISGCASSNNCSPPQVVPQRQLPAFPYVKPDSRPSPMYLQDFEKLDEDMQKQLSQLLSNGTPAKGGAQQ